MGRTTSLILEISQRQIDHKGFLFFFSNKEFLIDIANFLKTEVKETRSKNPKPEYRVRTTNLEGNKQMKNYLINDPLFGSKYLDSID